MFSRFRNAFPALARLAQHFSNYKFRVSIVLMLGLVVSSIQPLSVKITERLISELQKGQSIDPSFFRWVPPALILIFIVSGLAKYFYNTIRRTLAEEIISSYREELFNKYLTLPLTTLDQKRTGEMLSGLQNDLAQMYSGIETFSVILKEPFTFLGLMAVAFYCDWRLTLATLFVAPVVALLFSRTGSAVKRYSVRNMENFSDLMSLSQESLVGARIVKVFGLETILMKRFQEIQNRFLKTIFKSIRVQELATPLVEFVGALLIAGVVTYAGFATAQGHLTSGELVAFIIAIGLAQMPIKELNNCYLKLKNAEAGAERLYRILDEKEALSKSQGLRPLARFSSSIQFVNVSLSYGEKPVLHDISFEIKQGETIALVGQSGSGKTSLVNLLPRLYEVSSGTIRLDGFSIQEFDIQDLRKQFAFVTQDTFLFHDTIYNNVLYGNPKASSEDVEKACEIAYCSEFLRNLPLGLQTIVGDRGVMLSGGERQRVAIARAFLRNAPILVLDEATSNLDLKSEAVVQKALQQLAAGRTTLMIAHRLSTIRDADQIFVFENGKLIDRGSHQELTQRPSSYQEALSLQ
ncbi:MAG: ABC transporter ATP-binding protein [Pseudomonadota bacterium]